MSLIPNVIKVNMNRREGLKKIGYIVTVHTAQKKSCGGVAALVRCRGNVYYQVD
jgi:hypothetical protein